MLNYTKLRVLKKDFTCFITQIKQVFSHRHAKHKYAILYLSNNREEYRSSKCKVINVY